ncbi:MAG: hypothetical protein ACREB8_03765, partial [Pseudolabrys sp.]
TRAFGSTGCESGFAMNTDIACPVNEWDNFVFASRSRIGEFNGRNKDQRVTSTQKRTNRFMAPRFMALGNLCVTRTFSMRGSMTDNKRAKQWPRVQLNPLPPKKWRPSKIW